MTDKKVVLVTGVSSGIGAATVSALAQAGYRVFGSVRSLDAPVPAGVERVVLDVRDEASVAAGVASVLSRAGRIDALVNNAGVNILGAIEETSTAQAQDLFDVNFFGAVRLTRAVLPTMRAQRAGRVIFLSSVTGFMPAPFMGFYAASKHAIEGFAESLDHEVRTLGIRALLVEPTFTRTKMDKNSVIAGSPIDDYADARKRVVDGIVKNTQGGDDPALIGAAVVKALSDRKPRLRYPVGRAATVAKMRSFVPAGMFDSSLRKEFKLDRAN
jgi:NAD(P)-dependent dehydrogenase (short-subunit alcohol dehydrogenase family)